MKINHDYLKALLEAFEASPNPTTDIKSLQAAGVNYQDDQFIFHMQILEDRGLVEREDGEPGFGMVRSIDNFVSWGVVPLRLTASGHAFLEALRNKEVWATIKKDFKEASLDTLWKVSKELLEGYTKKKLGELLGKST
jgi:hypothetical protein